MGGGHLGHLIGSFAHKATDLQIKIENKLSWKCYTQRYNLSQTDNCTDKLELSR